MSAKLLKNAQQRLFFLIQLGKFKVSKGCDREHSHFLHHCMVGQLLGIEQASASRIIGLDLPKIYDIYNIRLLKTGLKILKDALHPANSLFIPLPSGRR